MASKQKYYVNLNPMSMEDISQVKIDDPDLIQYEIEATPKELNKIEELLKQTQRHDLQLRNLFSFNHFDETVVENDRKEFQHGMDLVFEAIYNLGTPETKRKLDEIDAL